jgi:uncharacterized membrane protein (UPF0127 family)
MRVIVVVALVLVLVAGIFAIIQATSSSSGTTTVVINGNVISVELFDTPEEQALGLSGRTDLSPNTGALFAYGQSGNHSIWMKDMRFSIDVLWLDENGRVVDFVDDMRPDTYPNTFAPTTPTHYVLELPDSALTDYGISIGTVVDNLPATR